jgi:membrane protein DedA with SNARE-associated domain/rhodanese-related sulfurtransferase
MDDVALLFHHHGVLGIVVVVFAKRMGVPVPAMPFLLLAGARGVHDGVFAVNAAIAACVAAVTADGIWFVAGHRFGRSMLALMCKLSISPDACIHRSELAFTRRGAVTVLLAKFIPGVAGLAPPLAGALGMSAGRFTALNLAGTMLWVGGGVAAGWLLHRQVTQIVTAVHRLGSLALPLFVVATGAYIAWLITRRALMTRAAMRTPRIDPRQVAGKIARGERLALVDVRGPKSTVRQRIPGAIHAFLDHDLNEQLVGVGQGVQLVVYCDCPSDVSAARVAAMLRKRGLPAQVLAGGFASWLAAGLPVESTGTGTPIRPVAEDGRARRQKV